jgi:hypothetical protein
MASNPAAKIARFKRKLESPEEKPNKKQKTGEKKEKESPPKEKKESKKSSNKAKDKKSSPRKAESLHFVLPEDDDFVDPVLPAKSKQAPAKSPKQVKTYSRTERAKSRKRPEEEEKERQEVLNKFKKNSSPQNLEKNLLGATETTDGVEKFTTEAPKLLTVCYFYNVVAYLIGLSGRKTNSHQGKGHFKC